MEGTDWNLLTSGRTNLSGCRSATRGPVMTHTGCRNDRICRRPRRSHGKTRPLKRIRTPPTSTLKNSTRRSTRDNAMLHSRFTLRSRCTRRSRCTLRSRCTHRSQRTHRSHSTHHCRSTRLVSSTGWSRSTPLLPRRRRGRGAATVYTIP